MRTITEVANMLPTMKTGNQLISALTVLPEYDVSICNENEAIRLMALSDIYKIYIPSKMSQEIYSKLYLALLRSLMKKGTQLATEQQKQNFRAIMNQEYSGIIGGSDSFTIVGTSGIGKSSAISRAINLITENKVLEIEEPYAKIIPCLSVQCPFDCSVKGLLLEILRKVDEILGCNYYQSALRKKTTTDTLIGCVSQVALNHIGLLVVDEIQNVVNSKNGRILVGALTQLINNSGISICMVGTPESSIFFEQAMQLARRSLGLQYGAMECGIEFDEICNILFTYQYVKQRTDISNTIIEWLYEHSAGIISVVASLIHDAQEIAILTGKEILNLETLNEAYQKRLSLLHNYIQPAIKKKGQTSKVKGKVSVGDVEIKKTDVEVIKISELVTMAKKEERDIVLLLKQHMAVEEVII